MSHRMSPSSHIHFRVCIISQDMIQNDVTWKRINLHSYWFDIQIQM